MKKTFITYRHLKKVRQFHVSGDTEKHNPLLCPVTFKIQVNHLTGMMYFSWAQCSSRDDFSRKEGSRVADERFMNGNTLKGDYNPKQSLLENCIRNICIVLITDVDKENPNRKSLIDVLTSALFIGSYNKEFSNKKTTPWKRFLAKIKNRKLYNDFDFILDYFQLEELLQSF